MSHFVCAAILKFKDFFTKTGTYTFSSCGSWTLFTNPAETLTMRFTSKGKNSWILTFYWLLFSLTSSFFIPKPKGTFPWVILWHWQKWLLLVGLSKSASAICPDKFHLVRDLGCSISSYPTWVGLMECFYGFSAGCGLVGCISARLTVHLYAILICWILLTVCPSRSCIGLPTGLLGFWLFIDYFFHWLIQQFDNNCWCIQTFS